MTLFFTSLENRQIQPLPLQVASLIDFYFLKTNSKIYHDNPLHSCWGLSSWYKAQCHRENVQRVQRMLSKQKHRAAEGLCTYKPPLS